MRRSGPARTRVDDEDNSSSPSAHAEDDEDVRSDFLADFDEQAFLAQLDLLNAQGATAPTSAPSAPVEAPREAPAPPGIAPSAVTSSASDFYGTAIQILTHILGSSTPYPWLSDSSTPRADDPAPWDAHTSHVDLPQLMNTLVERLGGQAAPTRVREQDLTHLLQTLLAQQGAGSGPMVPQTPLAPAAPPSAPPSAPMLTQEPRHFADLSFPDDEEDDPDFLPVPPENDAPSASAWTRAMDEVVPARAKRRESASPTKPKRGRPRQYTEEEAMARKRGRNRDYMARQREKKQAAPPAEQLAPPTPDDRLVLEAENRFLRAELERLREENAQLRGREEMRAYAARLGLDRQVP
ncbi:hypothetical protein MNAN1_003172 [Malassezia nana]|uniref:BZIP domain-containing protein n=1 Tax=Malassezia nana TaxID=180528 RepID=A0AAF0EP45_9BASI|nr:hypothetical protein MNAN1_003172 [Malassezia nana]